MADPLMRVAALFCALGALSPGAGAQSTMADPTRPPPSFVAPAQDAAAAPGPVLQSVIMPGRGKPLAVIDGQQVRLGQRYGESRLVRLTEREAVLEGPDGVVLLMLTPGVEKMNIATKSVAREAVKAPARERVQTEGKP